MCQTSKWMTVGCFLIFIMGCAAAGPMQPKPISEPAGGLSRSSREYPSQEKPQKESDPRALAALELREQARVLIERNRLDDAIRALERAVNLHPQDGKNYYYLAEAWLKKGDVSQASEYNRLAEIYFKADSQWMKQLRYQRMRIEQN